MESNFPKEMAQSPRERNTAARKQKFLEFYSDWTGTITGACEHVGISRETFYKWSREDRAFSDALVEVESTMNERVEDVLRHLIFIDHDGASVRYFLDRRHPTYMRKADQPEFAPRKTFEDILREEAMRKLASQQNR